MVYLFNTSEKDIQWSDTGVAASNKFLQKLWNFTNFK